MNRPESGHRTVPSAHDWREIDVYVTTAEGAYRYDPPTHTLKRVAAGDIRHLTGVQDYVAKAPLNLVYVADLDRMSGAGAEDKAFYRTSSSWTSGAGSSPSMIRGTSTIRTTDSSDIS